MAYPYFQEAADLADEDSRGEKDCVISRGFGRLGGFLAGYVSGNAEMREPDESEIRALLDACRDCISGSDEEGIVDDGYLCLTMIQEMLGLIREFAYGIRNAGISLKELDELLDGMEKTAAGVSAARESIKDIQLEIPGMIGRVREEMQRIYKGAVTK